MKAVIDHWPSTGIDGSVPPFDIELVVAGDSQAVRLRGELDVAYAAPVRAVLAGMAGREVLVDLRHLSFIDASGLSALVGAQRELAGQGRRLVLAGAQAQVRRVFELTGLARLLVE